MSEYPTIKAADIRPGDTIRWGDESYGMKTTFELTVKETWSATGAYVQISNDREIHHTFKADTELTLVDRPAPKLPTTPGRLVYVEAFKGKKVEPPILALLDVGGYWNGETSFPNGLGFCKPSEITDWSEATVTKAAP